MKNDRLPGIKEAEMRKLGNCAVCGELVGGGPAPHIIFYRVTAETCGLDHNAIQRQAGLEMMLGGHAPLAQIMGPDEDLAKIISKTKPVLVHHCCAEELKGLLCILAVDEERAEKEAAETAA